MLARHRFSGRPQKHPARYHKVLHAPATNEKQQESLLAAKQVRLPLLQVCAAQMPHLCRGRPLASKFPVGHGQSRASQARHASQHHHAEHPACKIQMTSGHCCASHSRSLWAQVREPAEAVRFHSLAAMPTCHTCSAPKPPRYGPACSWAQASHQWMSCHCCLQDVGNGTCYGNVCHAGSSASISGGVLPAWKPERLAGML